MALSFIRDSVEVSRGDLADRFGLDRKTVSRIVGGLLEESIVELAGYREIGPGRPQELLKLRGEWARFIGIDLGATHIIGLLADLNLKVEERIFYHIRPGLPVQVILKQMKAICDRLCTSMPAGTRSRAIGICVPGFVDPRTGVSELAENIPGWQDINLRDDFEQSFECPVLVDDSSRAWGRAELRLGANRGMRDAILLDAGYGIGMAIVADRKLHRGSTNRAGEVGHTVVQPGGPRCACGNRGCLEAVASGRAIAAFAQEGLRNGKSELLLRLTKNDPGAVTAQDVAIAASMGDNFSVDLLRRAGVGIGLALGNAVNILNPSMVILAGGLVSRNSVIEQAIIEGVRASAMPGLMEQVEVVTSELGTDGSALGAVSMAADTVFAPN
jgi:predicted NBD/HSP70 family sugar kinase